MLEIKPKSKKRAHQAIEVFQTRNRELIKTALITEGYGALGARDDDEDEDDWTDESDGTEAARIKSTKSARMRMRTRVVSALWKEASPEEREEVLAQVEQEKVDIREAELRDEEASAAPRTPAQLQEYLLSVRVLLPSFAHRLFSGIDGLETFIASVLKAIYGGSGWVGFSVVGGPNPRMGGELSMKMCAFRFGMFAGSQLITLFFRPRQYLPWGDPRWERLRGQLRRLRQAHRRGLRRLPTNGIQ